MLMLQGLSMCVCICVCMSMCIGGGLVKEFPYRVCFHVGLPYQMISEHDQSSRRKGTFSIEELVVVLQGSRAEGSLGPGRRPMRIWTLPSLLWLKHLPQVKKARSLKRKSL